MSPEFSKKVSKALMERYLHRDWGDSSEEQKQLNDLNVDQNKKISATYIIDDLGISFVTDFTQDETIIIFADEITQ
jgi:hypothetical protein